MLSDIQHNSSLVTLGKTIHGVFGVFFSSIETEKFYWLDHTKLLTSIKRMEGSDQNKLLHDALRLMAAELQGLKDFYKPDCSCAAAFFQI